MRFHVMHGGFRFELAAELAGADVRVLALFGKPNSHQRHLDAWQDIYDSVAVINRLIDVGAGVRELARFHAGDGAIGAVLDAASLRLRPSTRDGGMHAL